LGSLPIRKMRMARIRSIKPDFFRHEALFEAERETGLPLRMAFAGLWTAADREGRFVWSPRNLKLDALPYDDVDFSRVLDALWSRGFIVKYAVEGKEFGAIPSWSRHQIINNREKGSDLPEPNETNTLTRAPRVDDACATPLKSAQAEGKGKEGEGKGTDKRTRDASTREAFERFWKAYPKRKGSNPRKTAEEQFFRAVRDGADPEAIIAGARRYAEAEPEIIGTQYVAQALKWLRDERWKDYNEAAVVSLPSEETARKMQVHFLERWRDTGSWDSRNIPAPWLKDCPIPKELIEQYRPQGASL
jgi:hypothetical protein